MLKFTTECRDKCPNEQKNLVPIFSEKDKDEAREVSSYEEDPLHKRSRETSILRHPSRSSFQSLYLNYKTNKYQGECPFDDLSLSKQRYPMNSGIVEWNLHISYDSVHLQLYREDTLGDISSACVSSAPLTLCYFEIEILDSFGEFWEKFRLFSEERERERFCELCRNFYFELKELYAKITSVSFV